MEIESGNKIIAEFMGCYGDNHWAGGEQVFRYGFKNTHITERWHESEFPERTPYHYSWDWLMPVVEKIAGVIKGEKDIRPIQSIQMIEMQTLGIMSKKEDVYERVIQFIQWYTTNKPNPDKQD